MHKVIISDASCFIILMKINEINLLHQVYGEVTTTYEIYEEVGFELPEWVKIIKVKNINQQLRLELEIDKGESSAIALALENNNSLIILDDYKARKIAIREGLNITGTIGVIVKAKLLGFIESIDPIIQKIKTTDFRIGLDLELKAYKEANEI